MKTTLLSVDRLNNHIYSFNLSKPDNFRYVAGQFAEITLLGSPEENNKRWFTLSSAPSEKVLTFTTKTPSQKSAFKTALEELTPGSELEISQPLGDFTLPKLTSIPIVGLSGGMGITPFRSMYIESLNSQEKRNLSLFSSFRTLDDVIFDDVFAPLGKEFHLYVDERINLSDVLGATEDIHLTYYFLAGPESFIEELSSQLKNAEVPTKHIYTDMFIGL